MRENNLKPCPFCGNTDIFIRSIERLHFLLCNKCKIETILYKSKERLISDWNTRPAEDALQAVVERLANMKDPAEIGALICEAREIIGDKTK